ncbi:MAG: hypothetical protein GKS01_05765 [Alphaproteobacteria bacterium]|nr:hypothetical protein [Alphaproteobacteria bacterium]
MIEVISKTPGVDPERFEVNGSQVHAEMQLEPMTRADWTTHEYNVHFCIGLRNVGKSSTDITLSINGGQWDQLPDQSPLLYASADATGTFTRTEIPARTDLKKQYCIKLSLESGQEIYLANTLVRQLPALSTDFDAIAALGQANRESIGRSLDGRDIIAYTYGDPAGQPTLLITSGFHPPEPDTLASTAIMETLVEDKSFLSDFAVAVVPIANPDGYAIGTQGSNAADINFYWHFARELPDQCPEAAALWRFAQRLMPRGYIDFHSYTFQLGKKPGPYQRPLFFYDSSAIKEAGADLYKKLNNYANSKSVVGFGTYAPHTLGSMLVDQYDTLTVAKYHLHLAEGEDACKKRGVHVFQELRDSLVKHGIDSPAQSRIPNWRQAIRRSRAAWAGHLRPFIGNLRRGRLDQLFLPRTDQVDPHQ